MHAVRTGLAALCALATVLASPTPLASAADPGPTAHDLAKAGKSAQERARELGTVTAELATAQAHLDDLATTTERLVETYNGELVRLAQSAKAVLDAQAKLQTAEARLATSRTAVAAITAQRYGGVKISSPIVGMLSGQGDEQDFLQRATLLTHYSDEQAEILRNVRDSQTVAEILREQATEAEAVQRQAAISAAQAKNAAQQAVAEQLAETRRIGARRRVLQVRADAARGRAERLARARAAALQRRGLDRDSALALSGWARGSARMGNVVANWALSQLGKPYLWAADGPSSYDCSGLTMRAWEKAGVQIDHWTGTQWTSGPHVPLDELRRGDLLFFGAVTSNPGNIHHVGMYIGRGLMVHAPQTGDVVRIASMWRRDLVGATRPR